MLAVEVLSGILALADVHALALERVQARVPFELVSGTLASLAGQYVNPPDELSKTWGGGGLSGEQLHLFPDGTYLYTEWADIQPLTVYDKGSWSLSGELVTLASDAEVSWDPEVERRFVVLRLKGSSTNLLLGLVTAVNTFEALAKESPGEPRSALLAVAFGQQEKYDTRASGRVRSQLIREAWRPDYFRHP